MRDHIQTSPDDPKLREKFAKSFAPKIAPLKPRKPEVRKPAPPRPPKPEKSAAKKKNSAVMLKKLLANPPDRVTKDMPAGVLNSKQRSFVTALVHQNQTKTQAAKIAGYSPASASSSADDLMRLPKIQAAVAAERASYAIASGVTKKAVVDGMLEAVDMAKIKADPLAMIAGWREIGKLMGFYEPTKVNMNVSVNGQVLLSKMNTMSDAELLEQIAETDLTDPASIVSEQ